ncbi:hypothetical protein FFRU_160160 [Fructobacillus fructosus]|nr:hypothetical protein FFRU_160160 [Fructobacillus fructosus]
MNVEKDLNERFLIKVLTFGFDSSILDEKAGGKTDAKSGNHRNGKRWISGGARVDSRGCL